MVVSRISRTSASDERFLGGKAPVERTDTDSRRPRYLGDTGVQACSLKTSTAAGEKLLAVLFRVLA